MSLRDLLQIIRVQVAMRLQKDMLSEIKSDITTLVYDALRLENKNEIATSLWVKAVEMMRDNEIASMGVTFLGKRLQFTQQAILKRIDAAAAKYWDEKNISESYRIAYEQKSEEALMLVKGLLLSATEVSVDTNFNPIRIVMYLVVCRKLDELHAIPVATPVSPTNLAELRIEVLFFPVSAAVH